MVENILKPKEISKYVKDSKKFLEDVKIHINKNLDGALKQNTNKMIGEEFFPKDETIRELYNEVFACYYSNLHNASLSVAMELLEYMSKKLYSNLFSTKCPENWAEVLSKLNNFFKENNKMPEKELIECIDGYRKNVRNAQNHGNLVQLVKNNSIFYHNVINRITGEVIKVPLKYNKEIHGKSNFLKAKDEIQNQRTNSSIFLINRFIIQFFILQKY